MKSSYLSKSTGVFALAIFLAVLGCEPEETIIPSVGSQDSTATVTKKDSITNAPVVEENISAQNVSFSVRYDSTLEQTLYPSLILGLANRFAREEESFALIEYALTNPQAESEVVIKLAPSLVNEETTFRKTIQGKGEAFSFVPTINWDYEKLKTLRQSGNVNLTFTCFIDGKEVDSQTLRLGYRSINECLFGLIEGEQYRDLAFMFAAYVNEDHSMIDDFLEEALNTGIPESFNGYQGDDESLARQLWAIWYVLQQNGIKYSSITDTSNPSQRVFTQHVRFFDEVYGNKQANCVDGSVFLSSILKKVGIKPFLVLEPGHMYLGFYADEEKTQPYTIETTMVGNVDLREIYVKDSVTYGLEKYLENGYLPEYEYDAYQEGYITLTEVKQIISYESLAQAFQSTSYNDNIDRYNDPDNHLYQIFDIELLREVVQPIQ